MAVPHRGRGWRVSCHQGTGSTASGPGSSLDPPTKADDVCVHELMSLSSSQRLGPFVCPDGSVSSSRAFALAVPPARSTSPSGA